jgi:hypothetical protein
VRRHYIVEPGSGGIAGLEGTGSLDQARCRRTREEGARTVCGWAITFPVAVHFVERRGRASRRHPELSGARALAGACLGRLWPSGIREGAPFGASLRAEMGDGKLVNAPVGDRGCQSQWRLGVGSPSRKARRVDGMSFGSTPCQSHAGEAVAAKSRVISDSARGANHLPIIGKPTERVAAMRRRKHLVEVHIG